MKVDPNLIYKIISKWIKDLIKTLETLRLLEETLGKQFQDIESKDFLNQTPKTQEIKKIDK